MKPLEAPEGFRFADVEEAAPAVPATPPPAPEGFRSLAPEGEETFRMELRPLPPVPPDAIKEAEKLLRQFEAKEKLKFARSPEEFEAWVGRMNYPPEEVEKLRELNRVAEGLSEPGLAEPFVDPVMGATMGLGSTTSFGISAGRTVFSAVSRGLASALAAGGMEYPVGQTVELFAKDHPYLALPLHLTLGVLSGATVERWAERGLVSGGQRALRSYKGWLRRGKDPAEALARTAEEDAKGLMDLLKRLDEDLAAAPKEGISAAEAAKRFGSVAEMEEATALTKLSGDPDAQAVERMFNRA